MKYAALSAVILLLGVTVWVTGRSDHTDIGPPPKYGYDYSRPNYEPVTHPQIAEIGIAPVDLMGEITVDRSKWSAERDKLVAVTGRCRLGETKVPQAFIRAELYTKGRDGQRLSQQSSQITAKVDGSELPYRIELRMPSDSARLRLRVEVIHFPWDFDPDSGQLPDGFVTDEIADGEFTIK